MEAVKGRLLYGAIRWAGQLSPKARDGFAVAFFVLLSLAVFAPELLLDVVLLDEDIFQQSIPVITWYGAAAREGRSSVWTSGILGGFPIAFSQYSLLFPLDWLAARLLDPNRAYAVGLALYLPLAGAATYFYARQIGLSRLASLLAGAGYQLSTEALALGVNGYVLRSLFLLPVMLLSAELIVHRTIKWATLGAAAVGLSLLVGQVYITAIALLNASVYGIVRAAWLWAKGLRRRAALVVGGFSLAVLAGTSLAAVRVLPSMSVTAESVRSHGMSLRVAAMWAPDLSLVLAGYLLPLTRLFALNVGDPPSYVGPFVLTLATLAVFDTKRRTWVGIMGGLLLFDVLISMGENAPLFPILHQLPPFSFFRTPSRFSVASAFFLSLMAAQGLDSGILDERRGHRVMGVTAVAAVFTTIVFALALVSGLLWLYGGDAASAIRGFAEAHSLGPVNPLRPRIASALAAIPLSLWLLHGRAGGGVGKLSFQIVSIGGTVVLLMIVGFSMIPWRDASPTTPATVQFLSSDRSLFRVLSFRPGISVYNYLAFLAQGDPRKVDPFGPSELDFRYRYMAETLAPNFALQYGLESVDGYEVLQSARQAVALSYIGSDSAEIADFGRQLGVSDDAMLAAKLQAIRSRNLLDHIPAIRAFNVKYVLTNLELWRHSEELRLAFASQIPMLDRRNMTNVYVYEVLGSLPRAYLVPGFVVMNNAVEALDNILSEKVDPRAVVILEKDPPQLTEPRLDPARSMVEVALYRGSELELNVHTDGSGFLVINDAFYPGWHAWVDGVEAPIYVANGWVRAVPIESAGEHSVRLSYTPPLLVEGISLSAASLALCVAALVLPLRHGPAVAGRVVEKPGRERG